MIGILYSISAVVTRMQSDEKFTPKQTQLLFSSMHIARSITQTVSLLIFVCTVSYGLVYCTTSGRTVLLGKRPVCLETPHGLSLIRGSFRRVPVRMPMMDGSTGVRC